MKHLSIKLRALAPLSIRSDHAPDGAGGAKYIPGTTFLGSLAAAYRLLYPTETRNFERLFLSEQVHYSNLYPASFTNKDGDEAIPGMEESNLPVYPLPKTAQSCKRHDGFRFPESNKEKPHGVRDSLIDWAIFKIGSDQAKKDPSIDPLIALQTHKKCTYPHPNPGNPCHEAMDHFDGYYRRWTIQTSDDDDNYQRQNIEQYHMIHAQTRTRLRTHTGIDRDTGTVQDGILYNREVFEEDMRFWGSIRFPDDDKELIQLFTDFINEIGDAGLVRVGTGRTRGMGKVAIDIEREEEEQDRFALFKERLLNLNKLLHKQAEVFKLNELENTFFFALTLHSPLILCDDLLRYQSTIDTHTLTKQLGSELPGLQRIYQTASMRRVTGWQEMWGMPRINEYAIDTGSVFLFSFTCPSTPDETVLKALFELEERGAGKRRVEGFGRICISDQFHQEIVLR